jgi:hypothetical protein
VRLKKGQSEAPGAFGPKQTYALHMSAFEGKADVEVKENGRLDLRQKFFLRKVTDDKTAEVGHT